MDRLARLLGREKSKSGLLGVVLVFVEEAVGLRLGRGPKDRRETPDVLRRGTCLFVLEEMLLRDSDGP